jgi:hypothetical protein
MRITVRSPNGVYRLIDIQCDVEHELDHMERPASIVQSGS